jgi:antitoxin (DNA-binding transcriptional repressor) of toxin-antitoxin stability system
MAEPAVPLPRRQRIELPLLEARTRFMQILRLTPLTGQVTVITDAGRPVAAIVPAGAVPSDEPAPTPTLRRETSAVGWMRRIDQVRETVRRQHATRITELERALTDAWIALDRLAPRGADRVVDELRVAQRDVLPGPATDSSPQPS